MRTSVVVVGAGPGGLAMSHELTGAGIDHVLLERGEVANSWRTERWDSLRLLTPNWMTALPGACYEGDDPDGYMTAAETVATLEAYRRSFDPPLHMGVEVQSTCHTGTGFEVHTAERTWRCDAVVAATGGSSEPRVPGFASELPQAVQQFTSLSYRRPAQIVDHGRVLVVGASASGVQIADELHRAGSRRDDRGRRARTVAAFVPGPRHLLVAGPNRPARRALGRGGGPPACPAPCIGPGHRER